MIYLLDTNAITQAVRHPTGGVAQRVDRNCKHVATSSIVEAEIRFGIAQRASSKVGARASRYLASNVAHLSRVPDLLWRNWEELDE